MKYGYFDSKELASHDGEPSPHGPMNVKEELLILLNKIREAYGKPIVVNSAYRSPAHNAAVGGVENSNHVRGLAADIRPTNKNMSDLYSFQQLCKELNTTGGVGFYDTFCHVDVRDKKAFWDYRKCGD